MLYEKLKALVGALPAQLAVVQSVLTVLAVEVVPLLPENVALRAGAVLVVLSGWVAFAVRVVSAVTLVPAESRGLLMPEGERLTVTSEHARGGSSSIETTR